MPEYNLDKALEVKLQGNECYKKSDFSGAISLYSEAIKLCPPYKTSDLSIMFQNRAAAHEQLEDFEAGLRDCNESLRLNNKYGKSYNRRCKILRRLVERLDKDKAKDLDERIGHLRQALEDVSVLALLDGFQQDQLLLVDDILKQLGQRSQDFVPTFNHCSYFRQFPGSGHFKEQRTGDAFQLHYCPIFQQLY